MNNLFNILKINALSTFGINKALKSKDSKEKQKLSSTCILMFFVVGMLAFYSYMYSDMMASSLSTIGAINVQLGLMMAACSIATLFFSISMVQNTIFKFKDYNLLMSLPIPYKTILTSRFLILYATNFIFTLLIMIPAGIVYLRYTTVTPLFYFSSVLTIFAIPLIPIIISTILGTVIAFVSTKFKRSNLVGTIFLFIIFLGIMFSSVFFSSSLENFSEIGPYLLSSINKFYPLTQLYIDAVCNGNILALLAFVLIGFVLFAIYIFFVSIKFNVLHEIINSKPTSQNFKMTQLKSNSLLMSLIKKELKVYFSSQIYVFNTFFSSIMMIVVAGGIIFYKDTLFDMVSSFGIDFQEALKLLPLIFSVLTTMCCTSCYSISFEGKNLWILKSLPIDTKLIFLAKAAVTLVISVPFSVIIAIVLSIFFKVSLLTFVFMLITPILTAIFSAFFGLLINLAFPNLTWESETVVIKQSTSGVVSIFSQIIIFMLITLLSLVFIANSINLYVYLALVSAVLLLIDFILYKSLSTKGVDTFTKLS